MAVGTTTRWTRRAGVLIAGAVIELAAGVILFALFAELPTARTGFGSVWFWSTVQLMAFSSAAGAALAAAALHATDENDHGALAVRIGARFEKFGLVAVAIAIAALGAFGGSL
ncbi:hypothetical protein [Nocardia fluminea]|uniref:hypothetical protein n=1 Tax=Nocardia fluminea TaxID=134984 RepID=UPI003D0D9E13